MSLSILNSQEALILENLNSQQILAVQQMRGPILVIAGAGSGKTAVLTRRCAYLILQGVYPGSILSLTFTNKAAKEMENRMRKFLQQLNIFLPNNQIWQQNYTTPLFCTFHALGVRLLREFGQYLNLSKQFSILDTQDQEKIIKETLKELNLDSKQIQPSAVAYFISLCKQELLTPENSRQLSQDSFLPIFHQIYKKYQQKLEANQVVDFDDLILKPYLLLKNFTEVKKICTDRWKHIQVDEFQDTNFAQFELVKLLAPVELIDKN